MDLSNIFDSLSAEELQQLKETAKAFLNKETPDKKENPTANQTSDASPLNDPHMMQKMLNIAGKFSGQDDRVRFFSSLKPLLSEHRQKKADTAIMILQMLRVQDLLRQEERDEKND